MTKFRHVTQWSLGINGLYLTFKIRWQIAVRNHTILIILQWTYVYLWTDNIFWIQFIPHAILLSFWSSWFLGFENLWTKYLLKMQIYYFKNEKKLFWNETAGFEFNISLHSLTICYSEPRKTTNTTKDKITLATTRR